MKTFLFFFFTSLSFFTKAQNDLKINELFYSFSLGAGIGSSSNFEYSDIGISGMLDFNLQKNKSIATLGYRGTGEFEILGADIPAITMSSFDLLYGRELVSKKIKVSLNAGLALVGDLERGNYLYSDPGFFGSSHYEKIKNHAIGFPISTKIIFGNRKLFNIGLEAYVNINKLNTFYGLNLCGFFKKYKFHKKKTEI